MYIHLSKLILLAAYNLMWFLASPLILLYIVVREIKRKNTIFVPQRWGFLKRSPADHNHVIWFHAASVGESLAVEYLIKKIAANQTDCCIYMTVGTKEGFKQAEKIRVAHVIQRGVYDFLPSIIFAFMKIRPSTLVILESELWPNLIFIAKILGVKLILLNARQSKSINNKSFLRALFFKSVLDCFDVIYTQSASDTEELKKLLPKKSCIETFGNIKTWNVVQKKELAISTVKPPVLILLAGSTHEAEWPTILSSFLALKKIHAELKLIVAPRHFTWLKTLFNSLEEKKVSYSIWSDKVNIHNLGLDIERDFVTCDVIVIAQIGILFHLYQFSKVFILGGTFTSIGGHNLMEPIVWQIPTIIGPHHKNIASVLLDKPNGIFICASAADISGAVNMLLNQQEVYHGAKKGLTEWLSKEIGPLDLKVPVLMNMLK